MNSEERPRIRSVQAVYGFLLVVALLSLAGGWIAAPLGAGGGIDRGVTAVLNVFGLLLATLAIVLPFAIGSVASSDVGRLAASPSAARELAEQQYVDHALLGGLPAMIACAYLAMVYWIAPQLVTILVGAITALSLIARFPMGWQFEAWCAKCGVGGTAAGA